MAGHGTNFPTLDFKPIWMRMVEDFKIAVVEKSGYSWREIFKTPRPVDTVLEETRLALELAAEKDQSRLFPPSMSGLEAMYWTNIIQLMDYFNHVLFLLRGKKMGLEADHNLHYEDYESFIEEAKLVLEQVKLIVLRFDFL